MRWTKEKVGLIKAIVMVVVGGLILIAYILSH
jgi:hypothetical protein